jgi:uncharacterized membrane protein YqjE
MSESNNHSSGLATHVGRFVRTGVGALRNRIELLVVEWQEERLRMTHILAWSIALVFAGVLAMLLFTATAIFVFREDLRIYVTAGFAILYAIGAILAWLGLRNLLKRESFAESIDQVQKDRAWLESLK